MLPGCPGSCPGPRPGCAPGPGPAACTVRGLAAAARGAAPAAGAGYWRYGAEHLTTGQHWYSHYTLPPSPSRSSINYWLLLSFAMISQLKGLVVVGIYSFHFASTLCVFLKFLSGQDGVSGCQDKMHYYTFLCSTLTRRRW